MKKIFYIICLLYFGCYPNLFGQEEIEQEKISFTHTTTSLKEVLLKIEKTTSYHFYFLDSWVTPQVLPKSFDQRTIKEILTDILKDTNLNFYIKKDQIYLIPNNLVYDQLPENFFGKPEKIVVTKKKSSAPIFQEKIKNTSQTKIKTIRIGREAISDNQSSYVLSGYVKDLKSGLPVVDAIIKVNNSITTQTDSNGFYSMSLPKGKNFIEVPSLQYEDEKAHLILYNKGTYNFNLVEKIESLDAVLINAEIADKVQDVSTGTEKIDIEESKNIPLVLGERDVLKVATTLPGISTTGEGSGGINVRGGRSDQNLMLLDDAVIYNPQHFFGIFSAINPFVLGDFTIYKGNIPSEYGGRLSSVFDMKTKKKVVKKLAGEGAIGPVTSNLKLDIPIVKEKSSLTLGGRGAYGNWILRSLDEPSLQKSEASFYDVIASYNHKINENNDLKATAYFSKDNFSISSDSLYVYSNALGSVRWDHTFNDKNKGSLLFSSSQYEFNIVFEGEGNNNFDLGYKISETEVKFKMNRYVKDTNLLTYGVASKLYAVQPGSIEPIGEFSDIDNISIQREQALESALFLSYKFDLTKKLKLDTGVRYSMFNALGKGTQRIYDPELPRNESAVLEEKTFDNNELIKTYTGPEFRMSARYLISPSISLKSSFNSTYQYIHLLSHNTTVSPVDTWKLSDLNIKPQRSQQYTFGIYGNLGESGFEASIEGFYKKSKNLLDFRTGAELLLKENVETETLQGEGKAFGIEILLKKQLGKLNGWLAYTYSRSFVKLDSQFSENRINGGDFFPSNFDKPHDISMVTNYKFTKRLSFSANFVYQTGRPITYPVGQFEFENSEFTIFSDRNKFRIPDFYRLDLGFNIEGNHKIKKLAHSFWSISVYNVLGRNNPYSLFFVTEDGNVKALQSSIFGIPIPTITYNFKF